MKAIDTIVVAITLFLPVVQKEFLHKLTPVFAICTSVISRRNMLVLFLVCRKKLIKSECFIILLRLFSVFCTVAFTYLPHFKLILLQG